MKRNGISAVTKNKRSKENIILDDVNNIMMRHKNT